MLPEGTPADASSGKATRGVATILLRACSGRWCLAIEPGLQNSILRWANPLFHVGILAVFARHVMGLDIPKSWTDAVGASEGLYPLMVDAPIGFQLHALIPVALFALWQFTRPVHAPAATLSYRFRPCILYRSRDAREGSRARRRGWDKVHTSPRRR